MGNSLQSIIVDTTGFLQQLQLDPCTMKHAHAKLDKAAAEAKIKSQLQDEAIETQKQEQEIAVLGYHA